MAVEYPDPFKELRQGCPILSTQFQGNPVPMILDHAQLREAARNWQSYRSDAPLRIPIPSEEDVRTMRQYPLEVDPPSHTAYRKLIEPIFLRPKSPEFVEKIRALIDRLIAPLMAGEPVEVVHEFAIPLQSYALAHLLNIEEGEARTWIAWGIHVFKDGDGQSKGAFLEEYCRQKFEEALEKPADDFFSVLNQADFEGRSLTMEERLGYANIAFAGGRDTIIHTITNLLVYLAKNPGDLEFLRESPKHVILASEEFFRYYVPITHLGRVCPGATQVGDDIVPPDGVVSLAWAAANRDPAVFEDPDDVKLDRKPNPHVAFGFGKHLCLGAHHARLLIRLLLEKIGKSVQSIEIVEAEELLEREHHFERRVGYQSLVLAVKGLKENS